MFQRSKIRLYWISSRTQLNKYGSASTAFRYCRSLAKNSLFTLQQAAREIENLPEVPTVEFE